MNLIPGVLYRQGRAGSSFNRRPAHRHSCNPPAAALAAYNGKDVTFGVRPEALSLGTRPQRPRASHRKFRVRHLRHLQDRRPQRHRPLLRPRKDRRHARICRSPPTSPMPATSTTATGLRIDRASASAGSAPSLAAGMGRCPITLTEGGPLALTTVGPRPLRLPNGCHLPRLRQGEDRLRHLAPTMP